MIQKIFNFAARLLSNRRKYDHISDVLSNLKWLNSHQFIAYFDLCMLHQIIATDCPSSLSSRYRFNYQILSRKTRQSSHLYLEHPKNNHGTRSFTYCSGHLFITYHDELGDVSVGMRTFKKRSREVASSM